MEGDGTTVLAAGATGTIPGGYAHLDRRLENQGSLVFTGASLEFGTADGDVGTLINHEGGTLTFDGGRIRRPETTGHSMENVGTLVRTGPGGMYIPPEIRFDSTGTIDVQSGELRHPPTR